MNAMAQYTHRSILEKICIIYNILKIDEILDLFIRQQYNDSIERNRSSYMYRDYQIVHIIYRLVCIEIVMINNFQ